MVTSVASLPNGGSLQIRSGVLRGIGPSGPIGAQGIPGPAGPAGPLNPIFQVWSQVSGNGTAGYNTWAPLGVGQTIISNVSGSSTLATTWSSSASVGTTTGTYAFQVATSGVYMVKATATFTAASTPAAGRRELAFLNNTVGTGTSAAVEPPVGVAAVTNADTEVSAVWFTSLSSTANYSLCARVNDSANTAVGACSLTIALVGAGQQGPSGPTGAQGNSFLPKGTWISGTAYAYYNTVVDPVDGNTYVCMNQSGISNTTAPSSDGGVNWILAINRGATGATGAGSSGSATYNALSNDSSPNTSNAPSDVSGTNYTSDAAIPYPSGTQKPYTPYYLHQMATTIEPFLNTFHSGATLPSGVTKVAGQIYSLLDHTGAGASGSGNPGTAGAPVFYEDAWPLVSGATILARVHVDSVPPSNTVSTRQASQGVIWIQV